MSTTATAPTLAMLTLAEVHPDPDQPRKHFDPDELFALAESIKQHGLIQPINVRRNTKGYVIVAGERRWRASKLAKSKLIPAIVEDSDDQAAHLRGTIENVARADLNVIEEGDAYTRIGGDQPVAAQIAKLVSRPEARVADRMRLARLPGPIRQDVIDGGITLDAARTLAGIAEQPGGDKVAVALAAGVKLNVFSVQALARDPGRCLFELGEFDPSEVEYPCVDCQPTGPGAEQYSDRGTGEQIKDGTTWRAATMQEWDNDDDPRTYRNCPTCKGEGVVVKHEKGAKWPPYFAVAAGGMARGMTDDAFAQLPADVQKRIGKLDDQRDEHQAAMKEQHGYNWYETPPAPSLKSDEIADAALAAGCAIKVGDRVLVTDPAFVAENLPPLYEADVATFLKKKGSSRNSENRLPGNGPTKSETEKLEAAKERERAAKGRVKGRQFNQDLGRAIQTKLGEVPVTADAMKLLVRTVLKEAEGNHYLGAEGHALWQRLTRADWPTTKKGDPVIPRKSDERAFCKDVLTTAHKELAAAKTPEQALAVLVRFLAHGVADATGLPNADLEGMFAYRTEAPAWRAFVLARLPKAIRDRAPKANGIPGRSYAWGGSDR